MPADDRRSRDATRLRLLTLRSNGAETVFGGGLACVPVPRDARTNVAHAIANAVIGPRPAGLDGTIDIAGTLVSLQTLPGPLLRPSATPTVDRPLLDDLWQEICAHRYYRLQSAHSSRRLLREEAADALADARNRECERATRVDDAAADLETLLAAHDDLVPAPSGDALALADEFDAFAALPPVVTAEPVDIDLPALESRVATARFALAATAGIVHAIARSHIEECHRKVVAAESALFEARRKDRPEALARYQHALAEEHTALNDAGVDSYASFLVAIAAGAAPVDLEARLRAELELADAEATLERAKAIVLGTEAAARDEQALELRARAAQLLGGFPGNDPAAELRALRVEHPDARPIRDEIARVLAGIGATASGDVCSAARDYVQCRAAHPRFDRALADEQVAIHNETLARSAELQEHERVLEAIEEELDRVENVGTLHVGALEMDSLRTLLDALVDCYREGELLAGRLPLVLDGAFDDLGPERAFAVAAQLNSFDDIQTIVVTSDRDVVGALSAVGATTVTWPAAWGGRLEAQTLARPARTEAPAPAAPPIQRAEPPAMVCATHGDKRSSAMCSQCARPSCVDCLVHVPREPELWCVTCAELMRTPNMRLLRRRGA
jgi:hypothetical protein